MSGETVQVQFNISRRIGTAGSLQLMRYFVRVRVSMLVSSRQQKKTKLWWYFVSAICGFFLIVSCHLWFVGPHGS